MINLAPEDLKPLQGTYALLMQVLRAHSFQVGRLGLLELLPGYYIYVGSALGSGGLRARVGRHLNIKKVRHWHIDYLLQVAVIRKIWIVYSPVRQEHNWAKIFQDIPGSSVPIKGFGSSDCQCESHLFYFNNLPDHPEIKACEIVVR
jgi:Uri superfamily endonuclease